MANRTSMTLQSTFVRDRIEFGGGSNSFIDDILQWHPRRPFLRHLPSARSSQTSLLRPQSESFSPKSQGPIRILCGLTFDSPLSIVKHMIFGIGRQSGNALRPSQFPSVLLFRSAAPCFFASRLSMDSSLEQTRESSQWHVARVEKSRNSFTAGCVYMCWTYWNIIKLPWTVCIPANQFHWENWFPWLASKLDSTRLVWSVQIDQFSSARASRRKAKKGTDIKFWHYRQILMQRKTPRIDIGPFNSIERARVTSRQRIKLIE
jgi:hypothetical protein